MSKVALEEKLCHRESVARRRDLPGEAVDLALRIEDCIGAGGR